MYHRDNYKWVNEIDSTGLSKLFDWFLLILIHSHSYYCHPDYLVKRKPMNGNGLWENPFKIDVLKLRKAQNEHQYTAQLSRFNNATRHHYSFIHSLIQSESDNGDGYIFLSVYQRFTLHIFLFPGKFKFK